MLTGRRLARKHAHPVAGGMPGQIDQDIDLVFLDLLGEAIVGPLRRIPPLIG